MHLKLNFDTHGETTPAALLDITWLLSQSGNISDLLGQGYVYS